MTGIFGSMMIIAFAIMLSMNVVDSYSKRGFIKASASDFEMEQEDLGHMKRMSLKPSCTGSGGVKFPLGSYACQTTGSGQWLVKCTGYGTIGDGWSTDKRCYSKCFMTGAGQVSCS